MNFAQSGPLSSIRIYGTIYGLPPDMGHGFHIHEFGNLSKGCKSTGEHFNPFNEKHGGRDTAIRHVGDLGNIWADQNGTATFDITAPKVTLYGIISVIGRACVVHAGTDDLGRGSSPLASINGNSGPEIGCGVIGLASE